MIFTSKQDQFAALCEPFSVDLVKQREQSGQMLSYYPVEVIRTRLNAIFMGDYEFRVKQVVVTEKTFDLSGELILHWVDGSITVVEEWGSSDILFNGKGNRVNDPAKTAASDCLKRCLAFVGCGAELYNEDYRANLTAQKQAAELEKREKAMFTCSDCGKMIEAGKVGEKVLTREEVIAHTRTKFKKRICLPCAKVIVQGGK